MIVAIVFWWYFLNTKLKILEKKISPVIDPRVKIADNFSNLVLYGSDIKSKSSRIMSDIEK